jgi:hypothetical protein
MVVHDGAPHQSPGVLKPSSLPTTV